MTLADQSWVLVTGASSGFGEEISRRYAAQGRLVLVARRIEKLQTLATETDVGFFGVCDNHLLDRSQAGDSKDGEMSEWSIEHAWKSTSVARADAH